jgi:hypothetical protein
MGSSRKLGYAAMPIGTATLLLAGAVAARTDDLWPWMPPYALVPPVSVAVVLFVCTAFAWTRRGSSWWQAAAVGCLAFLGWHTVSRSGTEAPLLLDAYEVLSLAGLGALLATSVLCIRKLSRPLDA